MRGFRIERISARLQPDVAAMEQPYKRQQLPPAQRIVCIVWMARAIFAPITVL